MNTFSRTPDIYNIFFPFCVFSMIYFILTATLFWVILTVWTAMSPMLNNPFFLTFNFKFRSINRTFLFFSIKQHSNLTQFVYIGLQAYYNFSIFYTGKLTGNAYLHICSYVFVAFISRISFYIWENNFLTTLTNWPALVRRKLYTHN